MLVASIVSVILTLLVLVLSFVTIQKGYAFKHTVDPIEKPVGTNQRENT